MCTPNGSIARFILNVNDNWRFPIWILNSHIEVGHEKILRCIRDGRQSGHWTRRFKFVLFSRGDELLTRNKPSSTGLSSRSRSTRDPEPPGENGFFHFFTRSYDSARILSAYRVSTAVRENRSRVTRLRAYNENRFPILYTIRK